MQEFHIVIYCCYQALNLALKNHHLFSNRLMRSRGLCMKPWKNSSITRAPSSQSHLKWRLWRPNLVSLWRQTKAQTVTLRHMR